MVVKLKNDGRSPPLLGLANGAAAAGPDHPVHSKLYILKRQPVQLLPGACCVLFCPPRWESIFTSFPSHARGRPAPRTIPQPPALAPPGCCEPAPPAASPAAESPGAWPDTASASSVGCTSPAPRRRFLPGAEWPW